MADRVTKKKWFYKIKKNQIKNGRRIKKIAKGIEWIKFYIPSSLFLCFVSINQPDIPLWPDYITIPGIKIYDSFFRSLIFAGADKIQIYIWNNSVFDQPNIYETHNKIWSTEFSEDLKEN